MDPTTFVEIKLISISLSGLIRLLLGSGSASFLLLVPVCQQHTFVEGMEYVLCIKMLTFFHSLFLPVTHPDFTFYQSVSPSAAKKQYVLYPVDLDYIQTGICSIQFALYSV